jgi:8-oxo-dGTP pyrophosphatase MutT (NUDIX family)
MKVDFFYDDVVLNLKNRIPNSLPGHEAHSNMLPQHRKPAADYLESIRSYKTGCVMSLLFPDIKTGEAKLILIQRNSHEKDVHADQISFPGGKLEESDATNLDAALRETYEEIGIASHEIEVLGNLTSLYIPPSNFMVYPFVGTIDKQPNYQLSIQEVKRVVEVNLSQLADEKNKHHGNFSTARGSSVEAPYYFVQDVKIWGATAMMIAELIELARH